MISIAHLVNLLPSAWLFRYRSLFSNHKMNYIYVYAYNYVQRGHESSFHICSVFDFIPSNHILIVEQLLLFYNLKERRPKEVCFERKAKHRVGFGFNRFGSIFQIRFDFFGIRSYLS